MIESPIDRLIRLLSQAQDIAARKRMRVHLRQRIGQAISAAWLELEHLKRRRK